MSHDDSHRCWFGMKSLRFIKKRFLSSHGFLRSWMKLRGSGMSKTS